MHDQINTLGGKFGFVAVRQDGTPLDEFHALWDEVQGPLRALRLVGSDGHVYLTLEGYDAYFFSNEAVDVMRVKHVAVPGKKSLWRTLMFWRKDELKGSSLVVAKLFGGVKAGASDLVRVDLTTGSPVGRAPEHKERSAFPTKALRKGI